LEKGVVADVFISYASGDRERIAPLVDAIEGAGFSVWWDPRIGMGSSFDREIERELDASKCVVVIWSARSVDSDWVRAEANEALERQILVPAMIDDVRPPLVFRRAQTARLVDWPESREGLEALISGVRDVCDRKDTSEPDSVDTAGSRSAAHTGHSRIGAARDLLDRPAVAVLPFADLSADGGQQHLADGLAEELITSLSYWRRFPVIARGAAFAWRGRDQDLREIGRALGARYILEGSVRREADRARVTARLCDAESGHQLWSQRYDRDASDLFGLQDEISTEIVQGIEPELGRAETSRASRKQPEDMDSWDACLKASSNIHAGTREGLERARELIDQALALEPESPLAHSLNALWCFSEGLQGWTEDPPRILARAHAAARRAHELDERDWFPLAVLGITTLWVKRDYAAGITLVRRALELNPSAASAYQFLGCIQQFDGDARQALEAHEAALRLNPMLQSTSLTLSDIALCHLLLDERDEAIEMARRAVGTDTEGARPLQRLVAALGHAGSDEAPRHLETLLRMQPGLDLDYIDATYPFHRSEDRERFLHGLRAAGWKPAR
jgi:adenylate cyclase